MNDDGGRAISRVYGAVGSVSIFYLLMIDTLRQGKTLDWHLVFGDGFRVVFCLIGRGGC